MIYCEPCRLKNNWPASDFHPFGACAVCGAVTRGHEMDNPRLLKIEQAMPAKPSIPPTPVAPPPQPPEVPAPETPDEPALPAPPAPKMEPVAPVKIGKNKQQGGLL